MCANSESSGKTSLVAYVISTIISYGSFDVSLLCVKWKLTHAYVDMSCRNIGPVHEVINYRVTLSRLHIVCHLNKTLKSINMSCEFDLRFMAQSMVYAEQYPTKIEDTTDK